MASLAQMERELIMERTRAGLQAARCQGRVGGRKRNDRRQGSGCKKAIGKRDATTRGGNSLGVRSRRCIVGCLPLHVRKGFAIVGRSRILVDSSR